MACETIADILVRESGRYLPNLVARRTFGVSPWMSLVRRGEFPSEMGETINLLVYERSAPLVAEPTWSAISTQDGAEGGACLPATTQINFGSTTRNFSLYRRVIEGQDFCAEDTRPVFSLMQQLDSISGVMADYAKIEWEIHDRHEYFNMCQYKVVVDNAAAASATQSATMATSYPVSQATAQLPYGYLNYWRLQLIRDGAAESAMIMRDGSPILTVISSPEQSGNIVRQNAALRTDLRDAGTRGPGNLLFQSFGIEYVYGGFAFLNDLFNRHFTYSGSYTEVPAFSTTAATKGQKAEVNSSWKTAGYEESFIFDPTVFTQLIPRPMTNVAPNFRFDPVTYTGIWKLMNIPDRRCNPDGNIIFHRCIMAAASLPLHPERGVAFVHLRCDPENSIVTCAGVAP